jgi:hypothetical protein
VTVQTILSDGNYVVRRSSNDAVAIIQRGQAEGQDEANESGCTADLNIPLPLPEPCVKTPAPRPRSGKLQRERTVKAIDGNAALVRRRSSNQNVVGVE